MKRGWKQILLLPILIVLNVSLVHADLEAVKAESKLDKRSQKALKNADAMLEAARRAYRKHDIETTKAALAEIQESINLAYQSLQETGWNPRKRARPYKRAEISTRKLLRRLNTFRGDMSYLDRGQIDTVIKSVRKVHDDLLFQVMGGGQ